MLKRLFQDVPAVLALLVLAGCSNNNEDMIALRDYTNNVVNRPPGNIEPLPEFLSYEAFTYSAAGLRGPFDAPITFATTIEKEDIDQVKPDENREKEELESFPVASLTMVGSMSKGDTLWVLIQDDLMAIHNVMVGSYLGRNHGRIIAASASKIDIIEIVPSGNGGWIERPQTIAIEREE